MIGKVVQLLGVEFDARFKIEYGIHNYTFPQTHRHTLNFADVTFGNFFSGASTTYIRDGYTINDRGDGFKDIRIYNGYLKKEDNEEFLLVIIPYANYLESNAQKVAGRYPTEAILEMHEGDIVRVSKYADRRQEFLYMAVKAGNEMFLIEKKR